MVWKYVGVITVPADIASAIADEWETTLKAETTRIYTSLTTKISDETAFGTKIATPSSTQYTAFLEGATGAWDYEGIKLKQRVKLSASYDAWDAGIESVFGGGSPTFPASVTAKKGKLSNLRRVIGCVGHRSLGTWEPVTMSVLLSRGDTRCSVYFDTNDTFTGTLEAVFDAKKGSLISPSLISEMVYASVMAEYMYEGGSSNGDIDTFLATEADIIDDLVVFAVDVGHTGKFSIVPTWDGSAHKVKITAELTA
jgi:hypothetical protein